MKFSKKGMLIILILFSIIFIPKAYSQAPNVDSIYISSNETFNFTSADWTGVWTGSDPDGDRLFNTTWFNTTGKEALLIMDFNVENATDLAGRGNNGVLSNNPYWNSTGGRDGSGAYQFNGSKKGLITIENSAGEVWNGSTNITTAIWFMPYEQNTSAGLIIGHPNTGANNRIFLLINQSGNGIQCGRGSVYSGYGSISLNNWHLAVLSSNLTHFSCYIDGSLHTKTSYTLTGGVVDWVIGGLSTGSNFFNGSLDQVMIYNYTLSAEQILNIYNNASHVLDSSETETYENWTFNTVASDGTYYSSRAKVDFDIKPNYEPTAVYNYINTSSINFYNYTTDILWPYGTFRDNFTSSITVFYSWYNDSILYMNGTFGNVTNNTLTQLSFVHSNITKKYENWTHQVWATDGLLQSARNNFTIMILNSPPYLTASIVKSNKTSNLTDTDWLGNQTVTDSDDDSVFNTTWFNTTGKEALLIMDFNVENATDLAGRGNNGALSNNPYWNSTGGRDGSGAYQFNGSKKGLITIENSAGEVWNGSTNITTAIWFMPYEQNTSAGLIIGHPNTGANNRIFLLINQSGNGIQCGRGSVYSGYGSISLNNWHLAVLSSNLTHFSCYIDGSLHTKTSYTLTGGVVDWEIGGLSTGSNFFNGSLDQVMIYNYTLSAEQILNIYNNASRVLDNAETETGESWSHNVVSSDRIYYTNRSKFDFTIENSNVNLVYNYINTSSANLLNYTSDNILQYVRADDNESDSLTYHQMIWNTSTVLYMNYSGNISNGTLTVLNTLNNNITKKYENWTFGGYVGDGVYNYTFTNITIMILNSPINITSASSDDINNITNDESTVKFNLSFKDSDIADGYNMTCQVYLNSTLNTTKQSNSVSETNRTCSFYNDPSSLGKYNISIQATEGGETIKLDWNLTIEITTVSSSTTTTIKLNPLGGSSTVYGGGSASGTGLVNVGKGISESSFNLAKKLSAKLKEGINSIKGISIQRAISNEESSDKILNSENLGIINTFLNWLKKSFGSRFTILGIWYNSLYNNIIKNKGNIISILFLDLAEYNNNNFIKNIGTVINTAFNLFNKTSLQIWMIIGLFIFLIITLLSWKRLKKQFKKKNTSQLSKHKG